MAEIYSVFKHAVPKHILDRYVWSEASHIFGIYIWVQDFSIVREGFAFHIIKNVSDEDLAVLKLSGLFLSNISAYQMEMILLERFRDD